MRLLTDVLQGSSQGNATMPSGKVAQFDRMALEFCARKVSAVSGDARKALDICRRAVELAENQHNKSSIGDGEKDGLATVTGQTSGLATVTLAMIHSVIKEMYVSAGLEILARASLMQKILLACLLKILTRDNVTEVTISDVRYAYSHSYVLFLIFIKVLAFFYVCCKMNDLMTPTFTELTGLFLVMHGSKSIQEDG